MANFTAYGTDVTKWHWGPSGSKMFKLRWQKDTFSVT